MSFFTSIRFNLTLRYCLTLAVILTLFSFFLYLTIRKQLYHDIDKGLISLAEALASPTMEPFSNSAASVFDQVLEDFIGPKASGKYVRLLDNSGNVTASSTNLQDTAFPPGKGVLRQANTGKVVYSTQYLTGEVAVRSITFPVFTDGGLSRIVQIFSSLEETAETLRRTKLVLGISIPLAILLFAYGGWFLAGVALKPVDMITRSARQITAENLGHRLEVVNTKDEIGRLAAAFNSTLSNLENSFKRTRRFSVDVSHELRTPLTILRGETELGLKLAKEPEEFREVLRSNLDEISKMSKIIEDLLFLAKAEEGGLYLDLQEIELHEFLTEIVQQFTPIAGNDNLCLTFQGDCPVHILGDRGRLRQILVNLLENAAKFAGPGATISILLVRHVEFVRVSVSDTGPGIPAEDLPFIFERFYRVDKARNRASGGSGLGLSLARSFTTAHGGTLEASSTVGEGTTFYLTLPLPQ